MDENKNTIIIAVCALCLFMTLIIACSRGCSSKPEKRVVKPIPKKVTTTQIEEPEYKEQYSPSKSSYSYSPSRGNPPALLSEEDREIIAKKYEENQKLLNKLKKDWFEEKLKDPNLDPVAREQYKLRSNPNFVIGMKAYDNKDYKTAIKSFSQITQDKNASPVSKYFACKSLMEVAVKIKDIELYFIAARLQANLILNEDLSMLGIEKNKKNLEWCDIIENSIRAKNDPKYFDKCVKYKLERYDGEITPEIEEYVKKQVEKDIEHYSEQFKELIE